MNRPILQNPASPMKSHKASLWPRILLALAACAGLLAACTPSPNSAAPSVSLPQPESLAAQAADAAAAEAYRQLQEAITAGLETALGSANILQQVSFGDPQRIQAVAALFAQSLNNSENPADRVLDPRAFQVGLTPDGIAFLLLTADSPWGKAGEVAIIDTGADKGMFVTVTGSGVAEGKLDLNQAGYYAAVINPLGEVKAVVDASRQWVHDLSKAEKLSSSSAWGRVVEAYLAGKIAYPAGLNAEQKNAFEKELVSAEAKLPLAEQKKLIEGRFDRSKSGVYEAVIKADGNLEYFDGSWKTLEAMKNKNGENIPWGESYRLSSKEDREKFVANVLAGNEATLNALDKNTDNSKNSAEKKGFDASNFDFLYVQFYADQESIVWKDLGEKMGGYRSMEGVFVIKNSNNKLMAIKIELSNDGYTAIADLESEKTLSFSSILKKKDVYKLELSKFLLGIPSATLIRCEFNDINNKVTESNEKDFLQKVFAGNLENILENFEKNPETLTKDVIIEILQIILIQ